MDKFCVKCGAELVNGVCPNCSREQTAPQYYPQQPVFGINPDDERFKSIFMSPKERFVCALGNGYLMNFLANGFIGNGFAVISDKRVYFRGTSYEIGNKTFKRRTQSSTVDLKDVTGTDVRTMRNIFLLIASIAGFILSLVILFAFIVPNVDELDNTSGPLLCTVCGAFLWEGIITLVLYFTSRKTFLSICYAGGNISFPLNWYPAQEGENFQKMLRIAKDNVMEEVDNAAANTMREVMASAVAQPQQAAAPSAADELAKYAQLYKDGIISEQELSDIKAKILAK